MRVIILEDEIQSQNALKLLLESHHSDVEIIAVADRVQKAKELIQKLQPDLVFLDVELPDGKGYDLLKHMEEPPFMVVFTTAHQTYAVTAFQFSALHFLLKPIDREGLAGALNKARARQKEKLLLERMQIFWETIDKYEDRQLPTRITISTQEGLIIKAVEEIVRMEAQESYTEISFAHEGKKILTSVHLKVYEEQFKRYREFVRVHRSHLVNLLFVEKYVRGEGGYLVLRNGETVNVSRGYRDELQERLQKL